MGRNKPVATKQVTSSLNIVCYRREVCDVLVHGWCATTLGEMPVRLTCLCLTTFSPLEVSHKQSMQGVQGCWSCKWSAVSRECSVRGGRENRTKEDGAARLTHNVQTKQAH